MICILRRNSHLGPEKQTECQRKLAINCCAQVLACKLLRARRGESDAGCEPNRLLQDIVESADHQTSVCLWQSRAITRGRVGRYVVAAVGL